MDAPTPEAVTLALRLGATVGSAARPALEEELTAAVAGLRGLFGAAACSVALLQPDGESLRFTAADGIGAAAIVGVVLGLDRGIAGWVTMTGQPIVVADVRADPRFARDVAEATAYVPSSIMAAPLLRPDGEVLGVVEVLDRSGDGASTGRDLDVLALVAAQLGGVVHLAQRFDRLGAAVVAGLTGDPADGAVAQRIVDALGEEDRRLAAVASAVAALVDTGPRGRRLVEQVLTAVAAYGADRR